MRGNRKYGEILGNRGKYGEIGNREVGNMEESEIGKIRKYGEIGNTGN